MIQGLKSALRRTFAPSVDDCVASFQRSAKSLRAVANRHEISISIKQDLIVTLATEIGDHEGEASRALRIIRNIEKLTE